MNKKNEIIKNTFLLSKAKKWNVFKNKKGFIGLWTDVFKGFLVGFIFGVLLVLLIVLNVIPFPISLCG